MLGAKPPPQENEHIDAKPQERCDEPKGTQGTALPCYLYPFLIFFLPPRLVSATPPPPPESLTSTLLPPPHP